MGLQIPFDPGGLDPKVINAVDDIIAALQTWANKVQLSSDNYTGTGLATFSGQPGFLAYNAADDVTQSHGATIGFDTEVYDEANNFSANVFTAPVAGRYLLSVQLETNTGSALQYRGVQLVTTARTYTMLSQGQVVTTDIHVAATTVIADMAANDTAKALLYLQSGTATVVGGSSPLVTFFSGRLLP